MKKTLSIILSIVMLFSIATTVNLSAYADGWLDNAKYADYNTIYTESCSYSEPIIYCPNRHSGVALYDRDHYYTDAYLFDIPVDGIVTFTFYSDSNYSNYLQKMNLEFFRYDTLESTYPAGYYYLDPIIYKSANNSYYTTFDEQFKSGKYYMVLEYQTSESFSGDFTFELNFKQNISSPSKFKVSARGTNSLKLSWSKPAGVNGCQLQRKSGKSYKTVTNTSSTSATVKNLSTATSYKFRVRSYKTVNGKKYYSDWKYLTTPTKPGKVSIKSPSTNSNHQIIVKWNKVTRTSGYQVQFARNKSCSDVIATKTISGGSKTSYTGNNFTKGRTYYVRVRAYKSYNGKKYYGAWSSVKSIKSR